MALSRAHRMTCRACGGGLVHALSLGHQWVTDFVEVPGQHPLGGGPLDLAICATCELVQLHDSYAREPLFGNHWFRSGISEAMREALTDVVGWAVARTVAPPRRWLDIGCNDGTLLGLVAEQVPTITYLAGCDPARDAIAAAMNRSWHGVATHFVQDFFDAAVVDGPFDVITAVAMFYDLEDPVRFLEQCRDVLAPDGVLVLQFNDLGQMVAQTAFDNICHEHTLYWSAAPFARAVAAAGLHVAASALNGVNGGSVRVALTPRARAMSETALLPWLEADARHLSHPLAALELFARRIGKVCSHLLSELEDVPQPLYCYGASSRGNTLLQALARQTKLPLVGCAERDPNKVGRYTVGTHLPILREEEVRPVARTFLCLPWHYWDAQIAVREAAWMQEGGLFVLPLPVPRLVGGGRATG